MKQDIIEKLELQRCDIEDVITEIRYLRDLLKDCLPLVDAMVGIGSAARPLKQEIEEYFNGLIKCPHGYFDWDLCPDCRH